ncbi:MAG: AsmA family protein [candidate division Zixibacteria bacterium]|nr:AsmA family protein [candidate division Zixibacteria bacterium]
MNYTRIFKILSLVIASLILLVAIAGFVLSLPPGENYVKGIIEEKASEALNLDISIDNFRTNLISRAGVDGISVRKPGAGQEKPLLQVSSISVEYSLLPLINSTLKLNSVEIGKVDVYARRDTSGQITGLESLMGKSETQEEEVSTESGFEFVVEKALLKQLNVDFYDDSFPLYTRVAGLSANADYTDEEVYELAIAIDSVNGIYDSLPFYAHDFTIEGGLSEQKAVVDTAGFAIEQLDIYAKAEAPLGGSGEITASINIAGNPRNLIKIANQKFELPPIEFMEDLHVRANANGSIDNPSANIQIELPLMEVSGARINKGLISCSYRSDSLYADTIRINTFGGSLNLNGLVALGEEIGYGGDLKINGIKLEEIWNFAGRGGSPYHGSIGGRISVNGSGTEITRVKADSRFLIGNMRYQANELPDIMVNLNADYGLIKMQAVQETTLVDAEIEIGKNESLSGNVVVDIGNLTPFGGFIGTESIKGKVNIQAEIDGSMQSPEASITMRNSDIEYRNFPVDSIYASVEYIDSSLFIDSLSVFGNEEVIDPANPPFGVDSLEGGFEYSLSAHGTLDKLSAKLDVLLKEMEFGGAQIDYANLQAESNGKTVNITRLEAMYDSLVFLSEGEFDIDEYRAKLTGEFFDLKSPTSSGENIEIEPGVAFAGRFQLVGNMSADFAMTKNGVMSAINNIHIFDLAVLNRFLPGEKELKGAMDIGVNFEGTAERPRLKVAVDATRPSYKDIAFDSLTIDALFKDDIIQLDRLKLYGGSSTVAADAFVELSRDQDGGYGLDEESAIEGKLVVDSLNLKLLEVFVSNEFAIEGTADMDIGIRGNVGKPGIRGNMSIRDGSFSTSGDSMLVDEFKFKGVVEDTVFTVQFARAKVKENVVRLQGTIRYPGFDKADISITALLDDEEVLYGKAFYAEDSLSSEIEITELPLNPAEVFIPEIEYIDGALNGNINASGSPDDPAINGDITLNNFALKTTLSDDSVHGGTFRISFDNERIEIDTLRIGVNNGGIAAGGYLVYNEGNITDADISLEVDTLSLNVPDLLILNLGKVDLQYRRSDEKFLLTGDVRFGETRFIKDIALKDVLPSMRSVEKPPEEPPELMRKTELDIRLRDSDRLWVDNNLARLRSHAEVGIIGSPAQPNFTGRLSIEEGYVLYLDRKFEIDEGVVFFVNPNRFNPEVAFKAHADVQSYQATASELYTIFLSIQGPLDTLEIDLYSEPALSQPDIISMLTFGATREQLTGGGGSGGTGGILRERVEMLTSQRISGLVGRKVGSALGLDEVSVKGNLFNINESSGPQLIAAKQITDRAKLTYQTTVGHLNEQSIRLNYKLTEKISLEGETDQTGNSALDLKYKLKFK